ncbi:hypothetical protein SeMB42_g06095 [Synchytrium endobioticum]|uniref:Uncharacterized protein n=1 Tax=Synchytrium endobioticum TaxID=286115 RepID=A0A507D3I5_9FUNG|nr:hypothetical protein SeMB42_g06095 [Synchytrium endobioticum]TPX45845.1 hypothetical protein SeLEV6574_g03606 [Synchytrium endobioticum]
MKVLGILAFFLLYAHAIVILDNSTYTAPAAFNLSSSSSTPAPSPAILPIAPRKRSSTPHLLKRFLPEPLPDPSYDSNGRGTVRILVPREKYESPNAASQLRTQQAWGQASGLDIHWVPMASGSTYKDYLTVVLRLCNTSINGFTMTSATPTEYDPIDLIWIDGASGGILSDCMIDLWSWDASLGGGHDPLYLLGGIVPAMGNRTKKLVSLPAEADFGMIYYNMDILNRYGFDNPPNDITELETQMTTIIQAEHALENYGLSGITSEYTPTEGLTVNVVEWLGVSNTSLLSLSNNVTVATTAFAQILVRVASWVSSSLIDPRDLQSSSDAASVDRFVSGKAIFLRSWTTSVIKQLRATASFSWGFMPIIPLENGGGINPSVIGGWWLGVPKSAKNPAGALRVIKYMTSLGYQRMNVINAGPTGNWAIPSYPALMNDASVVNVIGPNVASYFLKANKTIRPSLVTGSLYTNFSSQVSATTSKILSGESWVVDALGGLDRSLRVLLDQSLLNSPNMSDIDSTISTPTTNRGHSPAWLKTQLAGLLLVISVVIVGAAMHRRKVAYQIQQNNSGFVELKASKLSNTYP